MLKAQSAIDAAQFFARALAGSDTVTEISGKRIHFPWIEEYEIRTQTQDFETDKQQYTLRVSPSTLQKRKAQKALSEHLRLAPDFQQQEAYCELIYDVHRDWLALYLIHEEQKLLRRLDTVLQDRQRIFEKMAGSYDFDFQKLIRLQTDQNDLQVALHELSLQADQLRAAYGLSSTTFDFRDFITVEAIQQLLGAVASDSLPLVDAELLYEQELLQREMALERAESRQIFDFAQFRYEGPSTDLYRERLSLGIGLSIPNSGNRRLKMQELHIEQQALQREQVREAAAWQQNMQELQQKLLRDIAAFHFHQQSLTEERRQLQNLGSQIAKKEGYSPLLLLDIEERYIDTRLKSFSKQEDILYDYLRYMEASGRLCSGEDRNFLER